MTVPTEPSSCALHRRHREMLVICAAVIVLSLLLTIRHDGRVALKGVQSFPVPETCLTHMLFGFDCPACGLTRSFIELSRGQWQASLRYHRLGWMMALAVLVQLPYRSICLITGRSLRRTPTSLFGYMLITALLLNWLMLHAPPR